MAATATERAADYHQDPGERPTLSSSIAKLLIQKTPAHAKAAHPRLTDTPVRIESRAVELGTAVHQILLRDDRVCRGMWDSYRTKDSQTWRDQCYADGLVPVLPAMWDEAKEIAERVNGQILAANVTPTPFTKGTAEHVIRFTDNGAECRSLIDWLRDDHTMINDLKTTYDASPRKFTRHLFNMGYDIQAAFYTRAVEAEYGVTPDYQWVVAETKPPYPVTIVTLSERAMYSARVKVDTAISLWNECMASGVWPAYGTESFEADLPGWMQMEADPWTDVDLDEVPF